jgi:putative endonuclease
MDNQLHVRDDSCQRFLQQTKTSGPARKSFAHAPRVLENVPMFYAHVLRSQMDSGFYNGYTNDLRARLRQHKAGKSSATTHRNPWKLIYYEAYVDQADALGRERYLKSGAGRRFLKAQLRNYLKTINPIKPRSELYPVYARP